jgi:hypothetical protein
VKMKRRESWLRCWSWFLSGICGIWWIFCEIILTWVFLNPVLQFEFSMCSGDTLLNDLKAVRFTRENKASLDIRWLSNIYHEWPIRCQFSSLEMKKSYCNHHLVQAEQDHSYSQGSVMSPGIMWYLSFACSSFLTY